jgi:hypothetical protein
VSGLLPAVCNNFPRADGAGLRGAKEEAAKPANVSSPFRGFGKAGEFLVASFPGFSGPSFLLRVLARTPLNGRPSCLRLTEGVFGSLLFGNSVPPLHQDLPQISATGSLYDGPRLCFERPLFVTTRGMGLPPKSSMED